MIIKPVSTLIAFLATVVLATIPLPAPAAGPATTPPVGFPSNVLSSPPVIPAGTSVQTVQTIHGKSEVYAYLTQIGFNTSSFLFDTGSFQRRSSPFDSASHDVTLEISQSQVLSRSQTALDVVKYGSAHPAVAPGQTYATSWTNGCFRFTTTYTWMQGDDGSYQWIMTSFSWIRIPQCPAPTD